MHLALTTAIVCLIAVAAVVIWFRFAADVRAHRARVRRGSRVVETALGPVEVAVTGDGPPVLVSHGFGGGFDHVDARRFVDTGFQVIAPSRFGYLRSPMPNDPSPEKQADAFAALLDELDVERVAVVGISTGAVAAMCFAARHPKRCRSLVVIVPTLNTEPREPFVTSDLAHWLALKVAENATIRAVLGTDPFVVDAAPSDEQNRALDLMAKAIPIRERLPGMREDRVTMSAPSSIPWDRIEAPVLVVSTKDDRYGTHDAARLIASSIEDARLLTYRTGGHAWIGHDRELFKQIVALLLRTSLV